jgi:type IV pilus assembly protein PilM
MPLPSPKEFLSRSVASLTGGGRQLLGLDIGSSAIKLVQVKEGKGRYKLQKFGVRLLDPELIVDGTIMDTGRVIEAIKELLAEQEVTLRNVAMSISGHSVIVKKINVPVMSEEELEDQIRAEAEHHIPFDITDVNLDFHIVNASEPSSEDEPSMAVLLVAAKKEKLTELSEVVKEAGLVPCVVDVDAFAVENMYGINYDSRPNEIVALINIGASVTNINVLKGGTGVFTRDVSVGGNRYTEALQRVSGSAYEEAEAAKKGERFEGLERETVETVIDGVNTEVSAELARTLDFVRSSIPGGEIHRILLCGGGGKVAGLTAQLSARVGVDVDVANPFSKIDTSEAKVDPEMLEEQAPLAAVGVGLALRKIGDR